ncbi:hypothetical protein FXW30_04405 [Candidatus Liberibacter asiaticus]|nr:hypothetical protein FXW22_04515 [Candidatus Liberibacter asiaticus]KAE9511391.1 hypothetical protein FXW31_01705 [Candidatus Liberibacter asiaticus]KAE9513018.1 hypothetical protein FXW35_04530 [Candidatus Liberibacter asiaticus]KAE9514098.1 hypothetical protein FXW25_04320 [Candidatus Liberibacter asiaticus]KAE9515146.1 hypothetical protein FXW26_04300 [Candidatus Liberibacter asiaticus]
MLLIMNKKYFSMVLKDFFRGFVFYNRNDWFSAIKFTVVEDEITIVFYNYSSISGNCYCMYVSKLSFWLLPWREHEKNFLTRSG